jgi:hypothetical protein
MLLVTYLVNLLKEKGVNKLTFQPVKPILGLGSGLGESIVFFFFFFESSLIYLKIKLLRNEITGLKKIDEVLLNFNQIL